MFGTFRLGEFCRNMTRLTNRECPLATIMSRRMGGEMQQRKGVAKRVSIYELHYFDGLVHSSALLAYSAQVSSPDTIFAARYST